MFSCEFCKIFRNTFFREQLWVIAPISRNDLFELKSCAKVYTHFFYKKHFSQGTWKWRFLKKRIAKKLAMLKYQKMFRNNER